MKIAFTESAWNDYIWIQEHDRKLLKRINLLIRDATRTPFEGIGKPEPLRVIYLAAGCEGLRTNTALFIKQRPPN